MWLWIVCMWTLLIVVLAAVVAVHAVAQHGLLLERNVLLGLLCLWVLGLLAVAVIGRRMARRGAERRALDRSYRQLFEALPDGTFVLDWRNGAFGDLRQVNEAACRLVSLERDALLATPLCDLFAECNPGLLAAAANAVARDGRLLVEHRLVTPAGPLPVQAEFRRFESAGRPSVLLIVKDLGDRQAAEWALRRRDSQLTRLSSATRYINEDLREPEVLRRLVTSAMQVLGATVGLAGLQCDDGIRYAEYADMDGFHSLDLTLPINVGLTGLVWESLTVLNTNDAARDLVRDAAFAEHFHPVAVLAAPIIGRDGTPLGCIEVHDKVGGEPFVHDDGLILLGLATSAAVALENARMLQQQHDLQLQLLEREARLRRLAAELSRTEERQRRRIAEGLHDRIGQELAVMRMQLGRSLALHTDGPGLAAIEELRGLLDTAIADTRALTLEISPPMLYTLGLAPALEWLCERMEQQHGMAFTVHNETHGRRVSDDARALLYVSVRELLMNTVKHAHATSAEVRMTIVGEWLWLAVIDDGVGFVPEDAERAAADGFGLFSVRERLRGIGGAMAVHSATGEGTEIVLEAPLQAAEASAREIEDPPRDRG